MENVKREINFDIETNPMCDIKIELLNRFRDFGDTFIENYGYKIRNEFDSIVIEYLKSHNIL